MAWWEVMAAAGQSAGASTAVGKQSGRPAGQPEVLRPLLVVTIGGLLTAGFLLATSLRVQVGQPATVGLEQVARNQVDNAVLSLDPKAAGTAAEDARQCKTPLAFVTAVAEPGAAPGSIRIRSASYLSPPITVTDSPRRIALPFPAPYPTGSGSLAVEGSAKGLTLWLSPAWHVGALNGAAQIKVVWTPRDPC
jgi:hypothetical protein